MTFEQLKDAIAPHEIHVDNARSFTLIAHDKNLDVKIFTSGPVKSFLDEGKLGSEFERASARATHHFSSPQMKGSKPSKAPRPVYERLSRSVIAADEDLPPRPATPDAVTAPVTLRAATDPGRVTFRIDETNQVIAFLQSRLTMIQQLSDKKIAKAWIKGICPKKQARFPYRNRKQEQQTGLPPTVPPWWPDPETECPFTEPDHMRRNARMTLCLHLLRLRPTPKQLKEWNCETYDPAKTPEDWPRGWTEFLREFAGEDIIDESHQESKERTDKRRKLLNQLYEVAWIEEKYQQGELDGSTTYTYFEEVEKGNKVLTTKRTYGQFSVSSVADREIGSRRSSVAAGVTHAKKIKRDSTPAAMKQLVAVPTNYDIRMEDGQACDRAQKVLVNAVDEVNAYHPDGPNFPAFLHGNPVLEQNSLQGSCKYWNGDGHTPEETYPLQFLMAPLTCLGKQGYDPAQHPQPPDQKLIPTQPSVFVPDPHFQQSPVCHALSPDLVRMPTSRSFSGVDVATTPRQTLMQMQRNDAAFLYHGPPSDTSQIDGPGSELVFEDPHVYSFRNT